LDAALLRIKAINSLVGLSSHDLDELVSAVKARIQGLVSPLGLRVDEYVVAIGPTEVSPPCLVVKAYGEAGELEFHVYYEEVDGEFRVVWAGAKALGTPKAGWR